MDPQRRETRRLDGTVTVSQARWIATVAAFGALWGGLEMTLAPLGKAVLGPVYGCLMAGLGAMIALTARRLMDQRGTVMAVAVVAAVCKMFSVSGVWHVAVVGVLLEGAAMEAVLWPGHPGRLRTILAGAAAGLCPPLQLLGILFVQYGPAAVRWFADLSRNVAKDRPVAMPTEAWIVLAGVLAISAAWAALGAVVSWPIADRILLRLGRERARQQA